MHLALTVGQRHLELSARGSLWLKTARREVYVTRSHPECPWRPHLQSAGQGAGVWTGLGWEVTFNPVSKESTVG